MIVDSAILLVATGWDMNDYMKKIMPSYILKNPVPIQRGLIHKIMTGIGDLLVMATENGCTREEAQNICRMAMLSIDAEKHHLDMERVFEDFGMSDLLDKYALKGEN